MTTAPCIIDVRRLAGVAARLSDPFEDSIAVLRAADLTADEWRLEHANLVAKLRADPELRGEFERAFLETRRGEQGRGVVDDLTVAGDETPTGSGLPFGATPSPAFLDDIARIWSPPERASGEDATLPVRDAPSSATLPFNIPASVNLLKLEPYSTLVAELRARPDEADAIMMSHGLTSAEDRTRLHTAWKRRFESGSDLLRQFEGLVAAKMSSKGERR